ncbi:hypothetical protein HY632_00030 [Candidatus Uhrbacteria bacterium]|nr:hypothetical protein [Candidatus Uhrbacteria bacterium]
MWLLIAFGAAGALVGLAIVLRQWSSVSYVWEEGNAPQTMAMGSIRAGLVGTAIGFVCGVVLGVLHALPDEADPVPRHFAIGTYFIHEQVMLPPEFQAPDAPPCYLVASHLPEREAMPMFDPALYEAPSGAFCALVDRAMLPAILEVRMRGDGTIDAVVRGFARDRHGTKAATWL